MTIIKTQSFQIAVNTQGEESAQRLAILMPGRLDTKDYVNFVSHAGYLGKHGYLAVVIDPPGTWDSPGELADYSTTMYIRAVHELIDYFGNRPTLLLGHSRGGATAMLASDNPSVNGLVLVNAAYGNPSPPDPAKIEGGVLVEYRDIPPGDVRTKRRKEFNLPLAYFNDGAKYEPAAALRKYKGPKLLIHTSRDGFTPIDRVKQIYDELVEPKTFLEIDSTHDYRLFPEAIRVANNALGEFVQS